MKTVSRAYLRWINNLDREQFDALTDRRVWLFILATFVAIISIASYAPGARDFLRCVSGLHFGLWRPWQYARPSSVPNRLREA